MPTVRPTLALLLVAAAALARADGGFFPPTDHRGADLTEPAQRAVAVHLQGKETLLLFVDYAGTATRFGWVVPVPSLPEVELADPAAWNEVVDYYRQVQEETLARDMERARHERGAGAGAPPTPSVVVHLEKVIGDHEIAVISSNDAGALHAWLAANGFRVPEGVAPTLAAYVAEHWFFVAVKVVVPAGETASLKPLAIRFATDRLVFPLRISAANRGVTRVVLYTLDPMRADEPRVDRLGANAFVLRDLAPIRERCPHLVERAPELRTYEGNLVLLRFEDTYVPQVLRLLPDKIERIGDQLHPYGPRVASILAHAAATALASENADELAWGVEHLWCVQPELLRPATLRAELDEAARTRLRNVVIAKLGTDNPSSREGASELLMILGDEDDIGYTARLGKLAEEQRRGDAAIEALVELGSAESRRALARAAASSSVMHGRAALGLVASLQRHPIDKTERLVVARELLDLLGAEAVGDFPRLTQELLRTWTGQDLGSDWAAWRRYVEANPEKLGG